MLRTIVTFVAFPGKAVEEEGKWWVILQPTAERMYAKWTSRHRHE
jgi:hypothetical protein